MRGRETRQAKALDFHLQDSAPCACLSVCACVCVPVWKVKKIEATNVKPKQTKGKINARVPSTILLPEKTVI